MKTKIYLIVFCLFMGTLLAGAIPAKRGLWQKVRLADGTEVNVQLMGDENLHYYADADGVLYRPDEQGIYRRVHEEQLRKVYAMRRAKRSMPEMTTMRKLGKVDKRIFRGKQRGLIILAQFKDTRFKDSHDTALYRRIANEKGFSEGKFVGSIQDYFFDQSFGQFTLEFDVVGPVTLSETAAYYGGNDKDGNDLRPGMMTVEACRAVDDKVDFSTYDWDGDGKVDQVYVVYAGMGEADGTNAASTVWPHAWTLTESEYKKSLALDGVTIDRYACSNEINGQSEIEGIGIICHEFSHCMGFPDTYDVMYSGNFGMGNWDLMDAGAYAGETFRPVGYTAYERMMCGWKEPVELTGDTIVSDMKAAMEGGETYIICNKACRDEYYMLENRQPRGWDASIPGAGMLVTYVDFDSLLWANNVVNATGDFNSYGLPELKNTHQRLTVLHADNDDDSRYFSENGRMKWKNTEKGDTYPYLSNDSIGNFSEPAATLHHRNLNGRKKLNVAIERIAQAENGIISFAFRDFSHEKESENNEPGVIFYESFNACRGAGGNDGLFDGGVVGTGSFEPDNDGWEGLAVSGADRCVKSGTNTKSGAMTTPEFMLEGTAELTFMVAPFGKDNAAFSVVASGGASLSQNEFALERGRWTTCTVTVTGSGATTLTFIPSKRMFLDEVKVKGQVASGISVPLAGSSGAKTVYDLQGIPSKGSSQPRGIYIRGNRKTVCR
ncbi:MAG: M6 family metalloprotease domain-containing protein [Prevotella sp.]|nr:M6 family metalloprotease domain-containing protein [Prevotella sp.]MDY2634193.1 M6 family metalloprotease domain-containing protein [Prevotella sp.]